MPRFFFHLANGERDPDDLGIELPDGDAARLTAVQHAGELLKSEPERLWESGHWRVEVTDDRNVLLCTVIALAVDAPVPRVMPNPGN